MTAILILVGIAVVIIAAIILVTVPVKHVAAVARDFSWRRSVDIGKRVWITKKSKQRPRTSADVQNVEVHNADDPKKLYYTYEKRVWRDMRTAPRMGWSQATVQDPEYTLAKDEQVRRRSEWYQTKFVSETGTPYLAKVRFERWKLLRKGTNYQLGRNTFGGVRTIKAAKAAPHKPSSERA
jgi:hypothetical protein